MHNPTPILRTTVAAIAGILALVATFGPTVSARTDDGQPEIVDAPGDMAATTALAQLPPGTAPDLAAFAELYDIQKAEVCDKESADVFYLCIYVADIPDDWKLPAAAPGDSPLDPAVHGDVAGTSLDGTPLSDPKLHDRINMVDLTAHFDVKKGGASTSYKAVATLGAIDVKNPNATPKVDTRQYVAYLIDTSTKQVSDLEKKIQDVGPLSVKGAAHTSLMDAEARLADAAVLAGTPCIQATVSSTESTGAGVGVGGPAVCLLPYYATATGAAEPTLCTDAYASPGANGYPAEAGAYHRFGLLTADPLDPNAVGHPGGPGGPTDVGFVCPSSGPNRGELCLLQDYWATARTASGGQADSDAQLRTCDLDAVLAQLQAQAEAALAKADAAIDAVDQQFQGLSPAVLSTDANQMLLQMVDTAKAGVSFADLEAKVPAWAAVDGTGSGAPPAAPNPAALPSAPEPPQVILFSTFSIVGPDGTSTAVGGLVDVKANMVRIALAKTNVGGPGKGDVLTKFFVDSSIRGEAMDVAPEPTYGAASGTPVGTIPQLGALTDAPALGAATLNYGHDYVFKWEAHRAAPGKRLDLGSVGPSEQAIKPGGVATYYVTIRNVGDAPVAGLLSLSAPAAGWTHQVSKSDFNLGVGASDTVAITVTAVPGGASDEVTTLTAAMEGAGASTLSVHTRLASAAQDQPTEHGPGGHAGSKFLGMSTGAAAVTGSILGVLIVAGVATAAVFMARRR